MTTKLFGCVVTSLKDIIIVGQPSVGLKGSFLVYRFNKNNIDDNINDNNDTIINKNMTMNDIDSNIESLGYYQPSDGHIDDGFGISCKIIQDDNDDQIYYLIIGAHRHFDFGMITGAAYIYISHNKGMTWTYLTKLSPHKPTHKTLFGCSVDMKPNVAVVGSFGDNTEGWRVGSVHIFKKLDQTNWQHLRVLYPNMLDNNMNVLSSHFGFCISLSENFLAIGAPGNDSDGSVYLFFSENNWNDSLKSYKIRNKNKFGFSVKIEDHTLYVGAPGENGIPGIVYSYSLSNFFDTLAGFVPLDRSHKIKTISTKHHTSKALFGRSIHAYNKLLIVSGFGKEENLSHTGSTFLYKKIGDDYEFKLLANLKDSTAKELFGHSVYLTDELAIIGDPSDNKVHVYILDDVIGGNIRKWYGSSFTIEPIPSYRLEL